MMISYKKYLVYLNVILFSVVSYSQVGIGTTNPNGALEIESDDSGILIPRVGISSSTDTSNVTNPSGGSIVPSTMIYNDGSNGYYPVGFYFWSGSNWMTVSGKSAGDIKHGLQSTDHNGWYLLDGRALSSLPTNAQNTATSLGFITNLPNANDRVLKSTDGSQALGSITGSNTINVTQANLPNFDMTSTTATNGSHDHTGTISNDGNHNHGYVDRGNTAGTYQTDGIGADDTTLINPTFGDYTTDDAGIHNHTVTINTNGNHDHTVTINSGGSGTSINSTPASLVTNIFIYLGE